MKPRLANAIRWGLVISLPVWFLIYMWWCR